MDDRDIMQLKGRVAAFEAQVQFLYKHLNLEFVAEQAFDDPKMAQIYELVKKGNVLGAIQLHRQLFFTNLAEAKKAVDEISSKI
jgi:hypothetical protein